MTDQTPPDRAALDGSGTPPHPAPGTPPSSPPARRPTAAATPRTRPVQYRGDDLEAARGPGLGCFWAQVIVLGVLVVLTPVTVSLGWPFEVSAFLLFATIGLLLLTGQTIIFLLRLVAAERRGRRRPLASGTRTVGELEDAPPESGGPLPEDAAPESGGPLAEDAPAAPESGQSVPTRADVAAREPDRPDDVRQ